MNNKFLEEIKALHCRIATLEAEMRISLMCGEGIQPCRPMKRPGMTFAIPRVGDISIFHDAPNSTERLVFPRAKVGALLETLHEIDRVVQRLDAAAAAAGGATAAMLG